MSGWRKNQVMKLIELYEQCPCLYDVRNKYYHHRLKREDAVEFIYRNLLPLRPNTNPTDIKTKIKNIRSQYSKEKNEIEKSKQNGMGPDDVYLPQLYFYEHLKFVDEFIKCSPLDSNITREELIKSEVVEECDTLSDVVTEVVSFEPSRAEPTRVKNILKSSLKRKKSSRKDDGGKVQKRTDTMEDEYEVFGKYIASELRNITDKVLYQDTKWKIIQSMMEGVNKQLSSDAARSPSASSSFSGSSHNNYYSDPNSVVKVEHDYYENSIMNL